MRLRAPPAGSTNRIRLRSATALAGRLSAAVSVLNHFRGTVGSVLYLKVVGNADAAQKVRCRGSNQIALIGPSRPMMVWSA